MNARSMDPELRIIIVWTVLGAVWLALHLALIVRSWPFLQTGVQKLLHVAIPVLPPWTLWRHQQRIWVALWLAIGVVYCASRVVFR